jgi:hypothetical protein
MSACDHHHEIHRSPFENGPWSSDETSPDRHHHAAETIRIEKTWYLEVERLKIAVRANTKQ